MTPQPTVAPRCQFTLPCSGVNVGGHTVSMARLRALFEALGCSDVQTLIASGNVRFASRRSAPLLEQRIEAHLEAGLGFPVTTFLRQPAEVAAIPGQLPATAHEPGVMTYVGFLHAKPGPAGIRALQALATPVDRFEVQGRHLYWCCQTSIGRSTITGGQIERALGPPTTLRNLTTLRRLITAWCTPA